MQHTEALQRLGGTADLLRFEARAELLVALVHFFTSHTRTEKNRRADIPVCRGRARPGADELVLSRDRKGLVKPPRGASTPNPHDARLSPVPPLQEPSRDLWRPCVRCRRSYQRKQESGSRRARQLQTQQNGPQTPVSPLKSSLRDL